MSLTILSLFLITGLAGGLVGGLLGVGGGVLFVPCLHFSFQAMGYPPDIAMKVAVATSLAIILGTALSSAVGHSLHGSINPRTVIIMSAMSIPAAFLGSKVGDLIGGAVLQRVFGLAALYVSYQFLRPVPVHHEKAVRKISSTNLVMVGGVSGLVSSILGVGGGIVTVPLLYLVLDMPMNHAVANSSGLIVFTAISGIVGWILSGIGVEGRPAFSLGYVNIAACFLISIASVCTALLGTRLANRMNPNRLRFPFGLLLGVVGMSMVLF